MVDIDVSVPTIAAEPSPVRVRVTGSCIRSTKMVQLLRVVHTAGASVSIHTVVQPSSPKEPKLRGLFTVRSRTIRMVRMSVLATCEQPA